MTFDILRIHTRFWEEEVVRFLRLKEVFVINLMLIVPGENHFSKFSLLEKLQGGN